jgi:protoporphyrinogen oxidase
LEYFLNTITLAKYLGICGGDIKYLSSNSLLKAFYSHEINYGSVIKGIMSKKPSLKDNFPNYRDLIRIEKDHKKKSVWRLKYGLEEMIEKLINNLSESEQKENVKVTLHLNQPVENLEMCDSSKSNLKSKSLQESFDIVISSVLSKRNIIIF